MVRLGLVKNLGDMPKEYRLVSIRKAHGVNGLHTEVRSWPVRSGGQRFELEVRVGAGSGWSAELASILTGLGWTKWGMDPLELAGVVNLPPVKAMAGWGSRFWAAYGLDADVLLAVGSQRDTVMQGLRNWTMTHQPLTYESELDLDGQERERLAKRKERASTVKSWFRLSARH